MKIVTILIGLLLIFLLYRETRLRVENFSDVGNVGNILTEYIQNLGKAWSKGETFNWGEKFSNRFFYEHFPKTIQKPQGKEFTLPEKYTEWDIDSDDKKKFYEDLKPYVHEIIDQALRKCGTGPKETPGIPMIHFRCSDAPFSCSTGQPTDHCFDYHFQKYDFYKKALATGDYKEVDIITCNKHNSTEDTRKACIEYCELLKQELESTGITAHIRMCEGDALEDFSRMFYAPLVISIGSSMSFVAGFYGHGKFITSGHIWEEEDGTVRDTCKICEFGHEMNLLHKDSGGNYFDVKTIHEKLKS